MTFGKPVLTKTSLKRQGWGGETGIRQVIKKKKQDFKTLVLLKPMISGVSAWKLKRRLGLTHRIPVAAGRTGWFVVPSRSFAASFPSNLVLQMEADKKRSCDFPQLACVGRPPDTPRPPKTGAGACSSPPPKGREMSALTQQLLIWGGKIPPSFFPEPGKRKLSVEMDPLRSISARELIFFLVFNQKSDSLMSLQMGI